MERIQRAKTLSDTLRKLRQDMAEELAATQHRPSGWLPRTVFVEEDEYEAGFTQYEVTEIHSNGKFTGINLSTSEKMTMDLTEINIDWLCLLIDIYACECKEQNLPEEDIRRCDHCGRPMKQGYLLGDEYACSEECCLALYDGDVQQMQEDLSHADEDFSECYYTEWETYAFI